MSINQQELSNSIIQNHSFLRGMYQDSYFPTACVDKTKAILLALCAAIESKNPQTLPELYELTHAATDKINDLQEYFYQNDSEIETAARDCIAVNFEKIAQAYGFDADLETLVANRDW